MDLHVCLRETFMFCLKIIVWLPKKRRPINKPLAELINMWTYFGHMNLFPFFFFSVYDDDEKGEFSLAHTSATRINHKRKIVLEFISPCKMCTCYLFTFRSMNFKSAAHCITTIEWLFNQVFDLPPIFLRCFWQFTCPHFECRTFVV